MAKEICISVTPHETRLAILEDDQLAEIYYERENEYTLAGSIYKGRVTRVLPGMQSSFVDVGLERDAFLYVTDFLEDQEDADEYTTESNGGRREAPSRAESGEEPQAYAAERNGGERAPERGAERNPEHKPDRQQDRQADRQPERGGRRPAQTQAEPTRGSGRAGRERAREQVVAPLREAVPAAQDLEEKGDDESPEGTRRWRGRRGRRRGVRAGLPQLDGRLPQKEAPQPLEEAGPMEDLSGESFPLVEHGAPGGLEVLHAPEIRQLGREQGRGRGSRRSREPYAQASTLERSSPAPKVAPELEPGPAPGLAPAHEPDRPRDAERRARVPFPEENPLAPAFGGAIVLPGESISKYGTVPAEPGSAPAATATVPKHVRAVNYVAPRPATLVELSDDWDGGAVLPGETISRYREPSPVHAAPQEPAAPSTALFDPDSVALVGSQPEQSSREAGHESTAAEEPIPAQGGADSLAAPIAEVYSPFHEELAAVEMGSQQAVVDPLADGELTPAERVDDGPIFAFSESEPVTAESSSEAAMTFEPAEAETGPESKDVIYDGHQAAPLSFSASHELPVEAEPEFLSAALSPEQEAAAPHVATPEIVHPSEPPEYEPESGSASYRVPPRGASELRLPSPEVEGSPELEAEIEPSAAEPEVMRSFAEATTENREFPRQEPHTFEAETAEALAEPSGQLAGAAPQPAAESSLAEAQEHEAVPEFAGSLAASAQAEPAPVEVPFPKAPRLQILHADGSVDLAAVPTYSAPELFTEEVALPREPVPLAATEEISSPTPGFAAGEQQESESNAQQAPPSLLASTEFSDLVDRLQGFAPGRGLLEEETIDEEEYDFEPMQAHAEDGDQEDLEEETLDQHLDPAALSDAVRDSYLEQRVHHDPETQSTEVEEGASAFGFEEVDEEQEEFDEETEGEEAPQQAQGGEPQRQAQTDEEREARGRGRQGGRGNNRNGSRNGGRSGGRGRSAQTQDLPIISELLKQGQEILVQIAKEPIAKKGARITSHIALPGRFLVFMPTVHHVGVSRKIASDEERLRLKRILISEKGESSGGFIVRTAAEGASEEDLRADLRFLISLWTEIKQRSDSAKAPALIYHDLNLVERILRDQVSSNFATIWVDSEAEYERITRFLHRFQPGLVRRVKLYTKETPLFEHFGIQEEISKALKSKVWLKSGGSIVINQTEALVAIDINTGKYVGKTSRLEDTIVKTNLDAIPEIVRQIRLRDLGGIIVIDFIDMDERKNRNKVLAALEEELKNDRAPSKVLQFNDFGLVAITRKRVKQSLERTLSVTCETCTGTGMVKSPVTVCNEIYTEMRKMQKHLDGKDVMLRVNPEVVKQLKANNGKWINELEEMVTKTIIIKSDPALHPEQFDIH